MPPLLFPCLFSLWEYCSYKKYCKTVFTYNPAWFFHKQNISPLCNFLSEEPFKLFFQLFTTGALERFNCSLVMVKSSYHRATILLWIIAFVMSEESWLTNVHFPRELVINVINLENAWQFVQTIWQLWSGTVTDGCQKFIKWTVWKRIYATIKAE